MGRQKSYTKKKKRTPGQKALLIIGIILCVFVMLISAAYGVFLHYYSMLNKEEDPSVWLKENELELEENEVETENSAEEDIHELEEALKNNAASHSDLKFDDEDVYNLLLLGTDGRSGAERGRSDSMMIMSINRRTKKITLTSLMRDMYMDIPGLSKGNRLNAAYSSGGVERLFQTIEQNFKIPLDDFVSIDFFSFIDVVDILDGVTVDVSQAEKQGMKPAIEYICKLEKLDPAPYLDHGTGEITLNGMQALAYARIRHLTNGEYDRTGRQREILGSLFDKVKDQGLTLGEITALADSLVPYMGTNLSQSDILGLLADVPAFLNYELVSARIPFKGTYKDMGVRGMAVIGVDFEENTAMWHDVVYNGAEPQVD